MKNIDTQQTRIICRINVSGPIRLFMSAVIIALISISCKPKSTVSVNFRDHDLKTETMKLLEEWKTSYLEKDTMKLNEIMADEYVYAGAPRSKLTTKKESIHYVATMESRYLDIIMEDLMIRTYGSTAIATGKEDLVVLTKEGDTVHYRLRFTDVYASDENGKLRAVSTHSSPIEE